MPEPLTWFGYMAGRIYSAFCSLIEACPLCCKVFCIFNSQSWIVFSQTVVTGNVKQKQYQDRPI